MKIVVTNRIIRIVKLSLCKNTVYFLTFQGTSKKFLNQFHGNQTVIDLKVEEQKQNRRCSNERSFLKFDIKLLEKHLTWSTF